MSRLGHLGLIDTGYRRRRPSLGRRRCAALRPRLQVLEDRTVLSTIDWNTTAAPTGGYWDTGSNWVGGVSPGPNDDAVIDLTSTGTVTVNTNQGDMVKSVTTNSNTTFVDNGSLTVGTDSSAFGGPVTISSNSTLAFGAGASVVIAGGETITDDGTLTVDSGATVGWTSANLSTTEIAVNGTLNATDAKFDVTGSASNGNVEEILVNPGGIITPTGSTFSLPLFVPYNDVATLAAGSNQSFDQIEIDAGTLSSGTLTSTRSATTRWT